MGCLALGAGSTRALSRTTHAWLPRAAFIHELAPTCAGTCAHSRRRAHSRACGCASTCACALTCSRSLVRSLAVALLVFVVLGNSNSLLTPFGVSLCILIHCSEAGLIGWLVCAFDRWLVAVFVCAFACLRLCFLRPLCPRVLFCARSPFFELAPLPLWLAARSFFVARVLSARKQINESASSLRSARAQRPRRRKDVLVPWICQCLVVC